MEIYDKDRVLVNLVMLIVKFFLFIQETDNWIF